MMLQGFLIGQELSRKSSLIKTLMLSFLTLFCKDTTFGKTLFIWEQEASTVPERNSSKNK